MVRNIAFVFIKPHAVTEKVKELVKETFEKHDISIKKEGSIEAEDIDKKQKIDKHYYAIASKATILTPDKLAVPEDKFKEKFGVEWQDVLKEGTALNALDACAKLEVDASALDSMWAACKKADQLVKFGGGFYCGKLGDEGKGGPFYVFNGFFMSMRSKYVEPGVSIYYYVVEWDSEKLKWEDFRGQVLGPTDPATAPAESLRGLIFAKWREFDLSSEPNTGDNGVHASASPFEALAERVNWLGTSVDKDPFGKLLLRAGIPLGTVKDWCKDPRVTFGVPPMQITQGIFDTLEDLDSDWCLAQCQMIGLGGEKKEPKKSDSEEVAKLRRQLEALEPLQKAVMAIQSYVPAPMPKASKGEAEPKKGKEEAAKPKEEGKGSKKGGKKEEEKPPLREKKAGSGKGVASGGKGKGKGKGK